MIAIKKIFSFIKSRWQFFAGVALMIFLCAIVGQCNCYRRELADCKAASQFQQLQKPDSLKNASGKKVYEAPVKQTDNSDDIKKLSQQYFDLKEKDEKKMKRMQALIVAESRFRIHDTTIKYLPYEVYINPDSMVRAGDVVMPGTKFSSSTKYYLISGKIELPGFTLENLEVYNEMSFRIGEKKRGIFRSSMMTVQAVSTNPYITITGLNSITLKNRPNWWNRWGKPLAVGAISAAATKKFLK